jgi:hypothetical protein
MRSGWHEMSPPHIIFDEQVGSCLVQQLDRLERTIEPSHKTVQRSPAILRTIDSHSLRDKRSELTLSRATGEAPAAKSAEMILTSH